MKKVIALVLCIPLVISIKCNANENLLVKKRCTCYLDAGVTTSGHITRKGIIAGKRSDLGKVAALYRCDTGDQIGEFIGYFEFLDTGAGIDTDGDGKGDSIIKGLSVDVFKETKQEAKDWIAEYGDYVYIQYIEANG